MPQSPAQDTPSESRAAPTEPVAVTEVEDASAAVEAVEATERRSRSHLRRHRVRSGRPRLTEPVELEVLGPERVAQLTPEQRRGFRLAHWLWNTAEEGPRDFALTYPVGAGRNGVHRFRRHGLGHGGLVRWEELPGLDESGRPVRWPVLGDRVTEVIESTGVMGPLCPGTKLVGSGPWEGRERKRCTNLAGQSTDHLGIGFCKSHGGRWPAGLTTGGWLMGHAFGRELDLNPWDALLKAVRIAAGKSAYCEYVLSLAHDDLEIEGRAIRRGRGSADDILVHPDTGEPLGVGAYRDLSFWVEKSEFWADRLARYAKMAIDAGVAERLVERAQLDASRIVEVLNGTLDALGDELGEEVQFRLRAQLRRQLLALDERDTNVVNGEVVDVLPTGAGT